MPKLGLEGIRDTGEGHVEVFINIDEYFKFWLAACPKRLLELRDEALRKFDPTIFKGLPSPLELTSTMTFQVNLKTALLLRANLGVNNIGLLALAPLNNSQLEYAFQVEVDPHMYNLFWLKMNADYREHMIRSSYGVPTLTRPGV